MIQQAKLWMLVAILLVCGTCSLYAQTNGSTVRALPKVCIDNLNGTLTKEEPVEATITISYSDETTAQNREDSYRCLVKYRGATSIYFDKKSMRITFLEDHGDGKRDVDLPGLGRTDDNKVAAAFFGPDGRHAYDYMYYFNNIKANAAKRVAAYLANR